jgi:hypothetical protein
MTHPVFISIGPKKIEDQDIQAAVTKKEQELGRPLTSSEILQTMGEAMEPDPSKRIYLSARPAKGMPPLHLPED